MILSQGRRFLSRRTIANVKYSSQNHRRPQHVAPISSISSSSLPVNLVFDNNHNQESNVTSSFAARYFSSALDKKETTTSQNTDTKAKDEVPKKEEEEKEEESLKDTVRRMQQEKGGSAGGDDERVTDFLRQASSFWSTATEEVSQTWGELLRSGDRKDINKKIGHPQDTADGDKEYTGPVAIMVIDESENLTAWERMQKRLTDAPVIQGKYILGLRNVLCLR